MSDWHIMKYLFLNVIIYNLCERFRDFRFLIYDLWTLTTKVTLSMYVFYMACTVIKQGGGGTNHEVVK